jgi:predicted aspartyl protease
MKRFLPLLLSLPGFVSISGIPLALTAVNFLQGDTALAQTSNVCYMVGPSGQMINLNGLCGTPQPVTNVKTNSLPAGSHRVKIKRRDGGSPIVDVMFNGKQTFEMIVDTGASGTVLTQKMATALRVAPVGMASVDTASQKGVKVPVGYIKSMEVSGLKAQDLLVIVAGPDLDIGLLGQDFFKDFDMTIRQDFIEFHPQK